MKDGRPIDDILAAVCVPLADSPSLPGQALHLLS